MEWSEVFEPILYVLLSVLATILGYYVKKLGTEVVLLIKSKVGEKTYTQALELAQGIYIYLEDKYGSTAKQMGLAKKEEMEELLLAKFPTLTKTELDAINKTVWLGFQAGYDGSYSNKSQLSVSDDTNDGKEV